MWVRADLIPCPSFAAEWRLHLLQHLLPSSNGGAVKGSSFSQPPSILCGGWELDVRDLSSATEEWLS